MGLLTQLQPPIATALPVRKAALDIAKELASTPKQTQPIQSKRLTKCLKCLNASFWLPIGSSQPICSVCSPAASLALVAKQYFFDDWNNVWRVDRNQDGSESYVRETFEPGSPDVVQHQDSKQ